jgi:hypothetical protein
MEVQAGITDQQEIYISHSASTQILYFEEMAMTSTPQLTLIFIPPYLAVK